MPNNSGWRDRFCGHCAAGVAKDHDGRHRIPPTRTRDARYFTCTAPTEEEYIVQLSAKVGQLEADSAMLDWIVEDVFARKVYLRDYDERTGVHTFICCGRCAGSPRAAIRAAMEEAQNVARLPLGIRLR